MTMRNNTAVKIGEVVPIGQREMRPADQLFMKKEVDYNTPIAKVGNDLIFPLRTSENVALALAERERFDLMCGKIPWGTEDRQAFGEMLRALVITFCPANQYHLHLLKNIAALQWQIMRIENIQFNVFEAGMDSPGQYGLPVGTWRAMEFREESSELLKDLQRAINIFHSVRKRPIDKRD